MPGLGSMTGSKASTAPWLETLIKWAPWPDTATSSALQMGRSTGWNLCWGATASRKVVCQDLSSGCCKLYPFYISHLILKGSKACRFPQWSLRLPAIAGEAGCSLRAPFTDWRNQRPKGSILCITGLTWERSWYSWYSHFLWLYKWPLPGLCGPGCFSFTLGSGILPVVACLWIVVVGLLVRGIKLGATHVTIMTAFHYLQSSVITISCGYNSHIKENLKKIFFILLCTSWVILFSVLK